MPFNFLGAFRKSQFFTIVPYRWKARGIRKKGVASKAELEETLEKLKTLLE